METRQETSARRAMNEYEHSRYRSIMRWKARKPGAWSETLGFMALPLSWTAARIIPPELIQSCLQALNALAIPLVDQAELTAKAQVNELSELRHRDLRLCDQLASDVETHAAKWGSGSGALLGATGVGGLPLDITTLLTLSLQSIHRIALCYGYDNLQEAEVLAVLAAASADHPEKRQQVLDNLHEFEQMLSEELVEEQIKNALIKQMARGLGNLPIRGVAEDFGRDLARYKVLQLGNFFTAKSVAKALGGKLARRKAVQLVPLLGAVIGGVSNLLFLEDVWLASRCIFQERWLRDNGLLDDAGR